MPDPLHEYQVQYRRSDPSRLRDCIASVKQLCVWQFKLVVVAVKPHRFARCLSDEQHAAGAKMAALEYVTRPMST
jgi:hypothetical protein